MTDKALSVSDVLCSFSQGEIDLVYVHSVRVWSRGSASQRDVAVSSSPQFPESHHILVEFSCFIKPLFPLPTSLSIREGGGSHHDGELLGYSLLKGVYQDAVVVDSTACLGQFEGSGVLIKVSVELVHAEGINSLMGSVLEILWDEGFAHLFESLFRVGDDWVGQFHVPSFGEGGTSSFAQCVKEDQDSGCVFGVDFFIYDKVGLHGQEPAHGIIILSREVLR